MVSLLAITTAERNPLPMLAFVLSEIQKREGFAKAVNVKKPFSRQMDGPTTQVASHPSSPEFLRDDGRCAGPAKEVCNQVVRI